MCMFSYYYFKDDKIEGLLQLLENSIGVEFKKLFTKRKTSIVIN